MNKGIVAINKPKDWTSFDVVNKIKHQVRPLKVGHLGTLDPMATGVLLVTIGKATKLFDFMQEKTKTYIAEFTFGYETDTLDATGKVVEKSSKIPTIDEIKSVLPEFIGKIEQIPPKFSAKSINGKRAYDLARNNIEFEIKPKQVEIYDIKILKFEDKTLTLEICCGSGTYIRSIGRDIARKLDSLLTMTSLVRTKVGIVNLEDCVEIQDFTMERVKKIDEFIDLPILDIDQEKTKRILNGQNVKVDKESGNFKLNDLNDTIALVKVADFYAKMSLFLE